MSVSGFIWSIVQPSSWILWLLITALVLHLRGKSRWRNRSVMASLLLIILLGILPTGRWLLWSLERPWHQMTPPVTLNTLVVLGGAEQVALSEDFGMALANRYAHRWTAAIELARTHPKAMVIFSGGMHKRANSLTEADVFKQYWTNAGMDPARLLLERSARNSYSNAVGVAAMAGDGTGKGWGLVTSAFHLPRALAAFQSAGLRDITPMPTGFIARRNLWHNLPTLQLGYNMADSDLAFHEYAGLVYYRLLGRTHALWPDMMALSQE